VTECRVPGCYRPARARLLCATHYERYLIRKNEWRGKRVDEPVREYRVTEKGPCVCENSQPTVFAWFSRRVVDVEPQQGMIVECAGCGLPIEEYLSGRRQ